MTPITIATIAAFLAVVLLIWWMSVAFSRGRDHSSREMQLRIDALSRRGEAVPYPSLLRDESLSEIPTLDRLLHHSNMARHVDFLLRQAGMKMRAGVLILIILVL